MRLKRALDKAKKAREEAGLKALTGTPAGDRVRKPEEPEEREEWSPPVYDKSRMIELDCEKVRENRCVCMFPDAEEIDYYKVLRTQIQHRTRVNGWNTVMITSVRPGEGKTLTAINLAFTFAKAFHHTVFLVDCDLKRQNVHQYLGLSNGVGLIDYLVDDVPLKDLIVWPGVEKMSVISGGRTVHDSTELLSSPKMKAAVMEMKTRYPDRYVLFDVPPLLAGADALAFAPLVDSILMVVEAEKTALPDVQKALELIPKEKFLGFVLNRHKSPMNKYYRYYRG